MELSNILGIIFLSSFGTVGLIFFFILMNPEKIEKWGAIIGFCITKLGGIFRFVHKHAVQLDLQGNINDYVKKVVNEIPNLESQKVKIEYINDNQDRRSFIDNNHVVIRLRRNDPNDLNFVHGAFLFVSTSLLHRVKRYLSQSQRDALDLYVTTKLIEKEKPQRIDYFLDEYLHPRLKDKHSDRKMYFDKLSVIDNSGFFYPILIEELHTLGGKVFGGLQDDKIISDVRGLINFLERVALRNVGDDEVDLDFHGEYCKASIVIVGKALTIVKRDKVPYVRFITNQLYPNNVDTVYMLGNEVNKRIIDTVCDDIKEMYRIIRSRTETILLHRDDGTTNRVKTYFVILNRVDSSIVVNS